jgi:hypothetical protein
MDSLLATTKIKPRPLVASAILKQRQVELMRLLPDWKNAQSSGIFAENFFLDYFPNMLRDEAIPLFNRIGAIRKVHEIIPENNLRGTFEIEGEWGSLAIYFTLSPENPALIQAYDIREKKMAQD